MRSRRFTHAELRQTARGELDCLDDYSSSDVVRSLLQHAPPAEVGLVNAMRYLDLKLTLAGGILVRSIARAWRRRSKCDRCSCTGYRRARRSIPPQQLATRHDTKRALKWPFGHGFQSPSLRARKWVSRCR
jgi:hypothetical protein